MKKLLIYLLAAVFAFGCTQKSEPDNPVVAKVNKIAITKEDFLEELNRVPEWARDRFKSKEGKEEFLNEIIKKELIYQDAKKKRLHKDEEFLSKVEEFKKMTLLSTILKKEVEEKATAIDEAELKEFYDKNSDKFRKGAGLRASHILVDTKEEAEKILARIKKGESFSKLAKTFSKDRGSAQKGGDLGFFGRGRMVPEFERAAFSLKIGEVSNPVKTRFGYHIIKVTEKRKGTAVSFDEAREALQRRMLAEKQKSLFDSYIEGLKKNSKITKYEDVLAGISLLGEQAEEQTPKPQEGIEVK